MRADIQAILERQATWQRTRAKKPWAQKLRESVSMRHSLISVKKRSSSFYDATERKKNPRS